MTMDIETPHGPARATVHEVRSPRGALVLGHGAGGGIDAPDLTTASAVAQSLGIAACLVEQPYRVAGRKSPAPAHQLDTAWKTVIGALAAGPLAGLTLITGGRSSGARVACRTAAETGAAGVLCLAFPLHAPSRKPVAEGKTRLPELEAVDVPVLVVQGESDPFGMPPDGPGRKVVRIKGNHSLRSDKGALETAVRDWLMELLG